MRVYLSHAMRGKAGINASCDAQNVNCEAAIVLADQLRREFPKMRVYVPAESEPFVAASYLKGYLTIDQILELDCIVVDQCDVVVVYVPEGDELQGGRLVEYNHAIATHKPVVVFSHIADAIGYLYAQYRGELI